MGVTTEEVLKEIKGEKEAQHITEGKDQSVAESRKQKAEGREQRAENREQRAESG
jgi:hypothetical protein